MDGVALARASTLETPPPTTRSRFSRLSSKVLSTPKVLSGEPIIVRSVFAASAPDGLPPMARLRTMAGSLLMASRVDGSSLVLSPNSERTPWSEAICPVSWPVASR